MPDNTIKRSQSDSCVFCLIKKLPEKDYRGRVGEELLYKFPHYAALPQSQRCGSGEMTNTMASKWNSSAFYDMKIVCVFSFSNWKNQMIQELLKEQEERQP